MTIADTAALEVAWVPLAAVRWDDQPIDPGTVDTYAALMAGGGHLAPPILNPDYSIRDGHHRLAAHRALARDRARVLIVGDTGE